MNKKRIARSKRIDFIAAATIRGGGLLVVAAILGVFLEIVSVAAPVLAPSSQEERFLLSTNQTSEAILAVGLDDYFELPYFVTKQADVNFIATDNGKVTRLSLPKPSTSSRTISQLWQYDANAFSVLWNSGETSMVRVKFVPQYDANNVRTILPKLEQLFSSSTTAALGATIFAARPNAESDTFVQVYRTLDGIQISRTTQEENWLGEINSEEKTWSLPADDTIAPDQILIDNSAKNVLLVGDTEVQHWRLNASDPILKQTFRPFNQGTISTAAFVLGDYSIAFANSGGNIAIWGPARAEPTGPRRYVQMHHLQTKSAATQILASTRNKGLYVLTKDGKIAIHHVTNERLVGQWLPTNLALRLGGNVRNNGLVGLTGQGKLSIWELDNPHPEVNMPALFSKIWYEGYDDPEFVWQSSASSDDFEPKISLIPLIFGTMKATLFAMLFSIPLALLGAIYASQFLSRKAHAVVKPTVEIMAGFPSVVVGFAAALWFAPLLEAHLFTGLIVILLLPCFTVGTFVLARKIFVGRRSEKIKGAEFLVLIPAIVLSFMIGPVVAELLENLVFAGSFQGWLLDYAGIRYDQRNSIVIAFALGFAVIPVIFTLAEDALHNIPKSLTAASLALGASRWQTVWKVVIPSASPGIFAAIMIGFGRAVGETMIVLMATGNTPVLDWSIFNGMRTLSANIAVEIPEAPHNGSLYRVLFLSGLILFTLTFLANTTAEIVRTRLRKRYGQF